MEISEQLNCDHISNDNKPSQQIIDNIYVINLDRNTEKWKWMNSQISRSPYKYSRLSGSDGYAVEITRNSDNITFTGRQLKDGAQKISHSDTYHINCYPQQNLTSSLSANYLYTPAEGFLTTSAGEMGCACSHRMAWKLAAHNQTPVTLVFEDDVKILPNFFEHARMSLERTPHDFDLLYFYTIDCSNAPTSKDQWDFGKVIRYQNPIWGTQAYAISHKGAVKLSHLTENIHKKEIDAEIIRNNKFLDIYYTPLRLLDTNIWESDVVPMGRVDRKP